jgi:hypothetical protein
MKDEKHLGADAAAVVSAGSIASPQLTHAAPTHTPGPWHVDKIAAITSFYVTDNYGDDIARVQGGSASSGANAHLIAAAPEMYAVLREIAKSIECCPSCGCWPHDSMCSLVAAIAKAEGK